VTWIQSTGVWAPWLFVALFLAASGLMIWRLEAMSARGVEGTVLGTLVMPYCSGAGNIVFTVILARQGGPGSEVMVNALVNNVTNLTLLVGLPALLWGMNVVNPAGQGRARRKNRARTDGATPELNRLSLLLTLLAVLFFSGATWALGRDGRLDFNDGLVLVGLFLFWQAFHLFEVLKGNVRQGRWFDWRLPLDLGVLALGTWAVYVSTHWLVNWVLAIPSGFVSAKHLGWLSGWLMVLPNAVLALYYGGRGRPEVVYTSQVGDGHICIPLCVGLYALCQPLRLPTFFPTGLALLLGVTAVHLLFVALLGRLPRWAGGALLAAYGVFLAEGLLP